MKLRRSSYLLICLIALLSLLPGLSVEAQKRKAKEEGAKATPETSSSAPKIEFEKYTLPNGLQVILHVDRKLPIVHVNEWFHVGSKNEKPGRTGFAHLFEHMMFQGSKNASGEYFSYVEKAGANLREGGVNGTTDNDRTNYFVTAPSGNLEYLLWLESDRLATLIDGMDQAKLDNQRDVVKNERRQGLENVPYGRWLSLLVENLHPSGHPYNWPVIGSHEDLTAASLDDVKDFFRRYYTPNNLSLVIAGDFDPAEAKRLVEKYYGGIPAGPALDRPSRWIPKLEGERIVEVSDRVPQERVYMVWPAPAYFDAGEAELTLSSAILTDGLSSRLNKALIYDKQLCTTVNAFPFSSEISGAFVVIATARPGVSLSQIEQIITEEIGKLAQSGPTAAELDRAKTKQEYQFVSGLERIGGFGGKADLLNQYNTYLGDPNKFEDDISRYRRVSSNDLKETVGKWLNTRNRILLRFHPEKSGRPSQVALDRAQQPQLGIDRPFHAPEVKTAKLENGMEIYVVERPELPKASVLLATKAGTIADPAGKEGVANMAITNIDLGTKTKKALEIEDAFGNLGTGLQGFATREYSALTFEVLKKNLTPALAILSDVVLNPSFPESELEREKKRALDRLAQDAKNPNAVAARIGAMLAFGPNHPYGRPGRGLPSTVEKITREDLVQFHQNYFKPGGSALIFVGDVTLAEATELAKKAFGGWTGGAPPQITIPAPQPVGPGKIYIVDQQDAAQTVVSQLLRAPQRKTDDYYALNLADAVWGGGGFGTRLNLNLREDKGYSYGVFSNLNLLSSAGVWAAQGGVQTNKTKESVIEFLSELKFIGGQKPVSEKELELAKQARIRGYSQQFESLGRISGQIANLWAVGLPMSEMQRESEEISKTSLSAVNSAAQKYAVPEQSTLLLVGDLSKIGAGIKELNSGEVVVLDSEGKPVTR